MGRRVVTDPATRSHARRRRSSTRPASPGTSRAADTGSGTSDTASAAVKPSPEVDALVTSINRQRKSEYQRIANEHGITLQAVEARAGSKAIEKTPSGEYIDTGSGWRVK